MEAQTKSISEVLDGLEEEHMRVYAWRLYRLERAGFGIDAALTLAADKDVDVPLACAMKSAGCCETTVVKILT